MDLKGPFEEKDSLLEHILLGVVHTKTGDNVDLSRIVTIALLVIVNGLKLILFLLVQVAHLGQDFRVGRHFGDQDVVPFKSLSSHTDELVDVGNLVDYFITVWDYGVKLFKRLKTFIIVA